MAKIKKKNDPYWIHHTHSPKKGEYECSVCCRRYSESAPSCPGCGSVMTGVKERSEWVDEAEKWDMYLEDF